MPELDGLRGMAILLVWAGHYFAVPGEGLTGVLGGYWFRLGWSGVDLFFVLSGFLIGGILLDVRSSPSYFKAFYARRFFRIIPLYYAWIAAYILLVILGRHYLAARVGTIEGVDLAIFSQLLFLQNFHDFLGSTISFWWFASTWSLAVEEQFYLVAPLCVRYFSRRALAVFLIFVTVAAPALRLLVRGHGSSGPWLAYRLMPCRADSLAIGMLMAMLWRAPRMRAWLTENSILLYGLFFVLLAGVAFLWRWYSDPLVALTQTIGYTWIAVFFAVVVLLALTQPAHPIALVARLGGFRELGRVSYCIYIVHEAVFLFCHQIVFHALPVKTNEKVATVTMLAAAMTYAIAKLSWRFFEEPLLRRGHSYKYEPPCG
jgi:peptidoglycan/LPS O-acetylase OafA/YrhL